MNPGILNRQITIQRREKGVDPIGQPVDKWVDLVTTWASIMHKSGLATIKGDAEASVVRVSMRIRYRENVKATMRAIYRQTVYEIDAVLPDLDKREYVDLVCRPIDTRVLP